MRPASFITQQDIAGEKTSYINDAELRNAPDTHALRPGSATLMLMVIGFTFMRAEKEPSQRQAYEIAELGKPDGEATRSPEFLRFMVDENQPRIEGENLDFRDEVLAQIYDKGDPQPKRTLTFNIEVSDEGSTSGPPIHLTSTVRNWRRIGRIVFDEAVASYNGDFVIHFRHPVWRDDRNDPSTAIRVDGRKVR